VGYYNSGTLLHHEVGAILVGKLYGFGAEFIGHESGREEADGFCISKNDDFKHITIL